MNPADKIEHWAIDKLIPYARNSRTHSDHQIDQLSASLREWGWTTPVLIDPSGNIIAGHGRILAAKKLNIQTIPVVIADGWSDAKKRAYIIADNKLALNAGWDNALLALEFNDLKELGFDLDLTGFREDELEDLMPLELEVGLTDEDAVPQTPENPVTVLGDVWMLGKHRLMCGDSTSIDAIKALMNNDVADMVFTDPPYGMSYGGGRRAGTKPKNREKFGTGAHFGEIKGDDLRGEELTALVRDAISSAKMTSKEGAAVYVCFPWRTYSEFEAALVEIGLQPASCIVWDKKYIGLGNSNYRPQHEFIFYVKGESWHGDKSQSDVWSMSRAASTDYVHPTQKPVELIERALSNSSKKGDIVIDCFGGSGSTLIACEKNKRYARLMELDPRYCDVIIKRWQDFSGQKAVHAESGQLFGDLHDKES
jgi:DNA modification methylase